MERFVGLINAVLELAGILNDSRKLFLKNKKLMFFVAIFPICLNYTVYTISFFSIKSEVTRLLVESNFLPMADPGSAEYTAILMSIYKDIRLFVGSTLIFIIVYSIVSLFFSVAIVRASALTHKGDNVQIIEFLVLTLKSIKKPLVTYFYINLFVLGYMFLLFVTLLFTMMFPLNPSTSILARRVVVWIMFMAFGSYLAIVWHLSLVISSIEETYGIQALGKAARIAKGMKLKLFFLNLSIYLLFLGFGECIKLAFSSMIPTAVKHPIIVNVIVGFVVVGFVFMVSMFRLVAYTVSYFQCKIIHGEEVEFHGDVEYTKIPFELLQGVNVPRNVSEG